MKMSWGLTIIFLTALVFAGVWEIPNGKWIWNQSQAAQNIFQSYAKPLRAPAFSLEDLQGKVIDIQAYKGRVILLNFWATW